MPNVTISVTEELKSQMDELSEVNWSEICRKAISQYVEERRNPTPNISLGIHGVYLDAHHSSGYPTITAYLRIHNKMNADIVIDRILYNFRISSNEEDREFRLGVSHYLRRETLSSYSIMNTPLFLPIISHPKIESLQGKFETTFPCIIQCTVIVDGFKNPYTEQVETEIPIDKWKKFISNALKEL